MPPSFAGSFDLAVGDALPLARPGTAGEEMRLEIAALASLPGWQWVTKMGRMRSFGGKPTAPVLMSRATVAALGVERVRHWLADTAPDADLAAVRAELQTIADAHAGDYEHAHFGPGRVDEPSVKTIATGEVARRMRERSNAVIWVLGAIPLASLAVAVLGIANAVAAGIRARRREFGLLRSVGLEARQTRRVLLAEVVLITATAGVLSIGYGILAAWGAIALSLQLFGAGTGLPDLVIPWLDLAVAWLVTLGAALAAAWFPATALHRQRPVALLRLADAD